jgi:hypothetical protein
MGILFILGVFATIFAIKETDAEYGIFFSWLAFFVLAVLLVVGYSEDTEKFSWTPRSDNGEYVVADNRGDDAVYYFFDPEGRRDWVYESQADFVVADEPRIVMGCDYSSEVPDALVWPFKFLDFGHKIPTYSDCDSYEDTTFYLPESEMTLDMGS